jgi:RNA polymerase sigma factor (sigma-70 family)
LEYFTIKWERREKEKLLTIKPEVLAYDERLRLEEGQENLEEKTDRGLLSDMFQEMIKDLRPNEQKILDMRFSKAQTLEETGRALGLTRERIRQIERKAIERLREHPQASILRGYFTG